MAQAVESINCKQLCITVQGGEYLEHESPNKQKETSPLDLGLDFGTYGLYMFGKPSEYCINAEDFNIFNLKSRQKKLNQLNVRASHMSFSVRILAPTTQNMHLLRFVNQYSRRRAGQGAQHLQQLGPSIAKMCRDSKLNVKVEEGLPGHQRSVGYCLAVSSQDHAGTYTISGSLPQLSKAFEEEYIPKFHGKIFGRQHYKSSGGYGIGSVGMRHSFGVASMRVEFGTDFKQNNMFWRKLFRCEKLALKHNQIIYNSERGFAYFVFDSLQSISSFLSCLNDAGLSKKKIVQQWKFRE